MKLGECFKTKNSEFSQSIKTPKSRSNSHLRSFSRSTSTLGAGQDGKIFNSVFFHHFEILTEISIQKITDVVETAKTLGTGQLRMGAWPERTHAWRQTRQKSLFLRFFKKLRFFWFLTKIFLPTKIASFLDHHYSSVTSTRF